MDEAAGKPSLNISILVHRYHHFLGLIWPIVVGTQNISYILSWESPQVTLQVWLVLFLVCLSVGKYCLLLLSLAAVVAIATAGYLSHLNCTSVREQHDMKHSSPTHPSKVYGDAVLDDSLKYKIAEERKKRTLLDCRAMIQDLLAFLEQGSSCLEYFYDVLFWRDTHLSAIFYISLMVGILSMFLFPVSLSLCTCLCLVFAVNPGFIRVLQSMDSPGDRMTNNDDTNQDCTGAAATLPVPELEINVDPEREHFAHSERTGITKTLDPLSDSTEDINEKTKLEDSQPSEDTSQEDSVESNHQGAALENGECWSCHAPLKTFSSKRKYCRNCGNQFCQKCCSRKVPKSALGATSPAAQREKVLVCSGCWTLLNGHGEEPRNAVR